MVQETDFSSWLRGEMDSRGVSANKLARDIGCSPSDVLRWRGAGGESRIAFKYLRKVLDHFGGSLDMAFPGAFTGETAKVAGRVSAGFIRLGDEEVREIAGHTAMFQSSRYRALTTGDVVFLQVDGSSMEPHFPDGSLIACAKPSTSSIPDFTPVIMRRGEEVTFKLLQVQDDRAFAVPLNQGFRIQEFRLSDLSIDYIVLGMINPYRHGIGIGGTFAPVLRGG